MKKAVFVLIIALFIFFNADSIFAGFGVSPPYVISDRLYPGAHFEQEIVLSRGNPNEELEAKITVDAPEIEDWFNFKPGKEFLLPKGQQQVSMIVEVDIPEDVDYKNYEGYIYIKTSPVAGEEKAGVSIALGARVDIDLTVTELRIVDFKIRNLRIPDSEEAFHWWKIKLLGKIKFLMNLENIGNIETAPDRAEIEVYDLSWQNLLYQGTDKSLEKIKPFKRKDITAEFKNDLKPGQYWAIVKVFKNKEEILRQEKILLTIVPMEMSEKDWMIVASIILGTLIIIGIIISLIYRRRKFKE